MQNGATQSNELKKCIAYIQRRITKLNNKQEKTGEDDNHLAILAKAKIKLQSIGSNDFQKHKENNNPFLVSADLLSAFSEYIEDRHAFTVSSEDIGETMGAFDYIEESFVNKALRCMVAKRAHLRDSVAVFPVFDHTSYQDMVKNVAYYDKIKFELLGSHFKKEMVEIKQTLEQNNALTAKQKKMLWDNETEKLLNGTSEKIPLPEGHPSQDYQPEVKNKVTQELKSHPIPKEIIFEHYLKAASLKPNLLNNPDQQALSFDNYQQWIIPFRVNENHFTIAVIHRNTIENDTVTIQYYDSKNHDLDKSLKKNLIAFFSEKGFNVNYQCISSDDQSRESRHCAIFAIRKGIDVANRNANVNETPLLPPELKKLGDNEYHATFNQYRFELVNLLKQYDLKASVSPQLEALIVHQEKIKKLNATFKHLIESYEQLFEKTPSNIKPNDSSTLFNELNHYYKKSIRKIQNLTFTKKITNEDHKKCVSLKKLNKTFKANEHLYYELVDSGYHFEHILIYASMALLASTILYVMNLYWMGLSLFTLGSITLGLGIVTGTGYYIYKVCEYLQEDDHFDEALEKPILKEEPTYDNAFKIPKTMLNQYPKNGHLTKPPPKPEEMHLTQKPLKREKP